MIQAMTFAAVAFAVVYWIYFACIRLEGQSDRFSSYGLAAWLTSTIALVFCAPTPFWDRAVLVITYTALWVLAMNFMGAIANSVTLYMLDKLTANHSAGSVSVDTIRDTYDQQTAVEGRLVSLMNAGLVRRDGDSYTLSDTGRRLLFPFRIARKIFAVERVG